MADVNQNSSPEVSEDQTQNQPKEEVVTTPTEETHAEPPKAEKGSQTPAENLYAALAEERRLRKEAEDKLNNLDNVTTETDEDLVKRLKALEDKQELQELHSQFPELKNHTKEFEAFREDYPRHKGVNIAKLFLAEKGLIESPRKGLEKPTGGPRVNPNPDLTVEEVKNLRETNYRKYTDMVKKGLIKV